MTANLAGVPLGVNDAVRLMGVINVSPESFFKGSVKNKSSITKAARQMEEEGADFIDVGAMSTAPYLKTQISEKEEAERLSWAVALIRKSCRLPISVDTSRHDAALAGLSAGGDILNDISGLQKDPRLLTLLPRLQGLVVMAFPGAKKSTIRPILQIKNLLQKSVAKTINRIDSNRIAIDPGIGFFRDQHLPWWQWDVSILNDLGELKKLRKPLLVGVSRKSFIGHLLGGKSADERLYGSLAATTVAIRNGAKIIRTHDVAATKDLVRVMEKLASATAGGVRI